MSQSINDTLNQVAEGIQRIDTGLKRIGELTAASLLEMRNKKSSDASLNALAKIMKLLDGLPEQDRDLVFQSLSDFEAARPGTAKAPK